MKWLKKLWNWLIGRAKDRLPQPIPAPEPTPAPVPDPTPEPEPAPEPVPDKPLGTGSNLFVWKPIADHGGKLCIMLPAWVYSPDGKAPGRLIVEGEAGTFTSYSNGNRSTWRYTKPGAAYGKNVDITFIDKAGQASSFMIPDGAVRFEWVYAKP